MGKIISLLWYPARWSWLVQWTSPLQCAQQWYSNKESVESNIMILYCFLLMVQCYYIASVTPTLWLQAAELVNTTPHTIVLSSKLIPQHFSQSRWGEKCDRSRKTLYNWTFLRSHIWLISIIGGSSLLILVYRLTADSYLAPLRKATVASLLLT